MARRETRKEEAGKMSVEEAGKRGGEATKETHGHEFYREIGKKGGEERAREIREEGVSPETHEKLAEAGRKGGEVTKETHGREFYQEIGRKGGTAPRGAAARGEIPDEGEVIIRRTEKDLDVTFSSQDEAEEWRNRIAPMMEQEGYHFTREKPETVQAQAGEAAAGE